MANLDTDARLLSRIRIQNEFEARYWARLVGVPRSQLAEVISALNRAARRMEPL